MAEAYCGRIWERCEIAAKAKGAAKMAAAGKECSSGGARVMLKMLLDGIVLVVSFLALYDSKGLVLRNTALPLVL